MVCNFHFPTRLPNLEFGIEGHFRRETLRREPTISRTHRHNTDITSKEFGLLVQPSGGGLSIIKWIVRENITS